jgi:hypothetical protein
MVVGVGDPLSAEQLYRLRSQLLALPEVGVLARTQQEQLIDEIAQVLPFYAVTRDAHPSMVRMRGPALNRRRGVGRKPVAHVVHLLNDCADAWGRASGRPGTLWFAEVNESESPAVNIARAAMGVVLGPTGPAVDDLRRQIANAVQLRRARPARPVGP